MDITPSLILSIIRTLLCKTSPDVEDKLTSFLENSYRFLDEKFPKEGTSFEIRIRNATNEAEDILKHFMNDQILSIRSAINEFIRLIVVISLSTDNPSDYYHELKEVMLEINSICRNVKSLNTTKNEQRELIKKIFRSTADNPRYDFGEAEEVMVESNSISQTTAEVKSLSPTENVRYAAGGVTVGLDDDVLKIKDLLTGGSSKLHTIPIAGMGGIGKSTLAMNAYNDPLIMETFTVRAWVTVSQDYKTENVFSVLVDFFKEVGDVRSGKTMMEKVYKFLYGRKYT